MNDAANEKLFDILKNQQWRLGVFLASDETFALGWFEDDAYDAGRFNEALAMLNDVGVL